MSNLYRLETEVANILSTQPTTRDDDNLLYYELCEAICNKRKTTLSTMSFFQVMHDKSLKLPSMASVTRCRRKLQQEDINLWGKRRQERYMLQSNYVDYSRDE